jgi:Protein of unknown function (DUF2971)
MEINGPFDFRIFLDFSKLDTEERQIEYIRRALNSKNNEQAIKDLGGYDEAFKMHVAAFKEDINKIQTYFNNKEEELLIRYRILCLSEIWNNILMWSHYADQHRGYCLGFATESFTDIDLFGAVRYQKDYPIISPLDVESIQAVLLRTLCKSKDWSYEREYRIVQILNKVDRFAEKSVIFRQAKLKEVILGLNIKYDDALAIGKICKQRGV